MRTEGNLLEGLLLGSLGASISADHLHLGGVGGGGSKNGVKL